MRRGDLRRHEALNCRVTAAHQKIVCATAEGTGRDHALALSVGGQRSEPYDANISYAAPTVKSYASAWEGGGNGDGDAEGARTRGGQWILVEGADFGTAASGTLEQVSYGADNSADGALFSLHIAHRTKGALHINDQHRVKLRWN